MGVILACGAAAGCGSATVVPEPEKPEAFRLQTSDLRCADAYQERWMSIPNSRLVVNPFSFHASQATTQSQYCNDGTMPLNIGFLDPYSHRLIGRDSTLNDLVLVLGEKEGALTAAAHYETAWQPDCLEADATYEGGLQLHLKDFFWDEKTVVRRLRATGGTPVLAGKYNGRLHAQSDTVGVENECYRAAVAFDAPVEVTCFATLDSLLAGTGGVPASAAPQKGFWLARGDVSDLSCTVDTRDVALTEVTARARNPFAAAADFGQAEARRTLAWNRVLNRIPYASFLDMPELEALGQEKGVTADQILQDFYESWTLVYSSILPPNPEHNYPYQQVACGKASMWDEGEKRASHSASWESFFGIQLVSYLDPTAAWSAYRGLMSLVDEQGVLGGESLPSEKAHTAWILHQNQPDAEALREIYPALKRYLCWRRENPRWIHGDHDIAAEKDYDFASSLLLDLNFAQKIAAELGMAGDVTFWEEMRKSLYADIQSWFYLADRADPYQNNYGGGSMSVGATAWVVKSLWMEELNGEYAERTVNYVRKNFNPTVSFCGLTAMKYDSYAYTALGLLSRGERTMGTRLLESGIRDVVLARFLGEVYNNAKTGIDPASGVSCEGVRPSLFGASILIDGVYLTNGFVRYWGGVAAGNLYDRVSTVEGLTVDGKVYTLTVDGINGEATLSCDGTHTKKQVARGKFVSFSM